jgi:hypothetical protein
MASLYLDDRADPERAATILGAVEAVYKRAGATPAGEVLTAYEDTVAAVRSAMDEESWQAAHQWGQALSLAQTVELALGDL